jgi:hypothetical protein
MNGKRKRNTDNRQQRHFIRLSNYKGTREQSAE